MMSDEYGIWVDAPDDIDYLGEPSPSAKAYRLVPLDSPCLGPIITPKMGDRVAYIVEGVVTGYDHDAGAYTIRGNSRGAQHIDWTIETHWATEFHDAPS
jgi:hypothetical protein